MLKRRQYKKYSFKTVQAMLSYLIPDEWLAKFLGKGTTGY